MHPRLPNDRESALSMSCSERGRAGKACTYVSETASGHGALRGTSRHFGDDAGEGVPPRPHRDLPPSITPSKEAVAGAQSRRAVYCAAPAAAGAWSAPALLLGAHVKRGARTCGGANRQVLLASNWEIAPECARTPRLGARPRGAGRRMLSDV